MQFFAKGVFVGVTVLMRTCVGIVGIAVTGSGIVAVGNTFTISGVFVATGLPVGFAIEQPDMPIMNIENNIWIFVFLVDGQGCMNFPLRRANRPAYASKKTKWRIITY
jgi:hypothetical protein